jgi:CRP/FNR family transcriptional regulator, cyclic AMP receptor protein
MAIRASTSAMQAAISRLLAVGKTVQYAGGETVYSQGEECSDVRYIKSGVIEITVCSAKGKCAVLGLLGRGDFFGDECLLRPFRHRTAARVLLPSSIITIKRCVMNHLLARSPSVSSHFIRYLLARNQRMESDLMDHILNSSEQRLARILLLLAQYTERTEAYSVMGKINQETLAEMVGTTRSRVNYFMNKFRKLGFIKYNGGLGIHKSLVNVLQDSQL